jgi:hypothetical protein
VPIPQVDQMPAGLIPVFLLAFQMLREGRHTFTPGERARVELSRYRCFLLGLPEDLLADTPVGIVRMMTARNTTLRDGFDDATCGSLVRATMAAYLPQDQSLASQVFDQLERRFAKLVFLQAFLQGDREWAKRIGVDVTIDDILVGSLVGAGITLQMKAFDLAESIPIVRDVATAILVKRVQDLIAGYGRARFTSDAAKYRSAAAAA